MAGIWLSALGLRGHRWKCRLAPRRSTTAEFESPDRACRDDEIPFWGTRPPPWARRGSRPGTLHIGKAGFEPMSDIQICRSALKPFAIAATRPALSCLSPSDREMRRRSPNRPFMHHAAFGTVGPQQSSTQRESVGNSPIDRRGAAASLGRREMCWIPALFHVFAVSFVSDPREQWAMTAKSFALACFSHRSSC